MVTVVDPFAGASLVSKTTVAAHQKDINSVAISPNDQLVASASQDKTAKVVPLTLHPMGLLLVLLFSDTLLPICRPEGCWLLCVELEFPSHDEYAQVETWLIVFNEDTGKIIFDQCKFVSST